MDTDCVRQTHVWLHSCKHLPGRACVRCLSVCCVCTCVPSQSRRLLPWHRAVLLAAQRKHWQLGFCSHANCSGMLVAAQSPPLHSWQHHTHNRSCAAPLSANFSSSDAHSPRSSLILLNSPTHASSSRSSTCATPRSVRAATEAHTLCARRPLQWSETSAERWPTSSNAALALGPRA